MAGAIEMSHLALETLMKALQGVGHAPCTPTISLPRYFGRPESPCELTIDEWLSEFDMCLSDSVVCRRESESWC